MQWTGTFGNVTRLQATRLCQKFIDMRIVEDVRKTANGRFFDDGHLYRFVESHVSSPASRLASRRVALSTVVVANTHAKLDKTPGKRKRRAKVEEEVEEEDDADDSVIPMIIENSHADHAIEMKEMNFGDAAIPEDVSRLWKEVTLERYPGPRTRPYTGATFSLLFSSIDSSVTSICLNSTASSSRTQSMDVTSLRTRTA